MQLNIVKCVVNERLFSPAVIIGLLLYSHIDALFITMPWNIMVLGQS